MSNKRTALRWLLDILGDASTIGSLPSWYAWVKSMSGLGLGGFTAYFAWAQHIPVAYAIPAVLCAILLTLLIWSAVATTWLKPRVATQLLQSHVSTPLFCEDRKALNATTGGFEDELDNLREGLAMWPGGVTTIAYSKDTFSHIDRLIVLDPDNADTVKEYCRVFFASEDNMVSTIRDVTRRAQEAGVKVRWSHLLYIGLIVNDPKRDNDSSYARVEVLYPGVVSASRSNFIVKRKSRKLFDSLLKAYECAWDESRDAPHLATPQARRAAP